MTSFPCRIIIVGFVAHSAVIPRLPIGLRVTFMFSQPANAPVRRLDSNRASASSEFQCYYFRRHRQSHAIRDTKLLNFGKHTSTMYRPWTTMTVRLNSWNWHHNHEQDIKIICLPVQCVWCDAGDGRDYVWNTTNHQTFQSLPTLHRPLQPLTARTLKTWNLLQ